MLVVVAILVAVGAEFLVLQPGQAKGGEGGGNRQNVSRSDSVVGNGGSVDKAEGLTVRHAVDQRPAVARPAERSAPSSHLEQTVADQRAALAVPGLVDLELDDDVH